MSQKRYRHKIALEPIKTIADVLSCLHKLDSLLAGSDLEELAIFNQAYIIITRAVQARLTNKGFAQPREMERLDVIFAKYYFRALNQYAQSQTLPAVWQTVITGAGMRRPSYRSLLLAANAHINHDLPLAIAESGLDQGAKADFDACDQLFRQSARPIIQSFSEDHPILNLLKRSLRWLYARPIMAIIIHYRHRAWQQRQALLGGRIDPQRLVVRTRRIARYLA